MPAIAGKPPDALDSAVVADAAVSEWRAVDAALAPIVGHQGVAALYNRSLQVTVKAHPWLERKRSPEVLGMELDALRAQLAGHDAAEAHAASRALFHAFTELLASLVGAPLAERLLGPLWIASPAGDGAFDRST